MRPNGFVGECRHTVNYVLSGAFGAGNASDLLSGPFRGLAFITGQVDQFRFADYPLAKTYIRVTGLPKPIRLHYAVSEDLTSGRPGQGPDSA